MIQEFLEGTVKFSDKGRVYIVTDTLRVPLREEDGGLFALRLNGHLYVDTNRDPTRRPVHDDLVRFKTRPNRKGGWDTVWGLSDDYWALLYSVAYYVD